MARRALMQLLDDASADAWADAAVLAVSEVITNALMHTGVPLSMEAWASPDGVRVEVMDGSSQLPAQRNYALTSGTGRGLHIVDQSVQRWGAEPRPQGKVVWFELGSPAAGAGSSDDAALREVPSDAEVPVTLRNMPLLMHWAWQEHAQALLREYLLFALDTDDDALDDHARASEVLSLLYEQIPVPELPDSPEELLAGAIEPGVTADDFAIRVPRASVPHFATLDRLLTQASAAASGGRFLGPPTQPEIAEMRQWICSEVVRQTVGEALPRPWRARTDVRVPLADETKLRQVYRELAEGDEAILATDPASIIVAVSPAVVDFLGYESESDLLGRRIIVVVPQRYHQAHIAGTTLNATNGRRVLLDLPLTVPVVRADGSEVDVELTVTPRLLDGETHVFIASFELTPAAAAVHPHRS